MYVGPAAIAEYAAVGGTGPVPLESAGGTYAGVHWSEAVFGVELMTGWITDGGTFSRSPSPPLEIWDYGLAPRGLVADAAFA